MSTFLRPIRASIAYRRLSSLFLSRSKVGKRIREFSMTSPEGLPRNADTEAPEHEMGAARTKEERNDIKEALLSDNPCWGSPSECSLSHLLQRIGFTPSTSKFVLHESSDYIAIDKPPDVRMDGPYRTSVQKLLTYWYPSEIVKQQARSWILQQDQTSSQTDSGQIAYSRALAQYIGDNVHLYASDNELRPCHQLDYATSGVLLVARSADAANRARVALEERRASKTYTALVYGHLHLSKLTSAMPKFQTTQEVHRILRQLEDAYRRRRNKRDDKRKAKTFDGFQPPHAIFQQWQQWQLQRQKPTNKKRKRNALSEEELAQVWKALEDPHNGTDQGPRDIDWESLQTARWKEIRQQTHIIAAFKRASDIYNDILRARTQEVEEKAKVESEELPIFFQTEDDKRRGSDSEASFYIFAPMAAREDDFAMCVPHKVVEAISQQRPLSDSSTDEPSFPCHVPAEEEDCESRTLDFKPSLTKCTIVEHSQIVTRGASSDQSRSLPVTKVRLEPKTGRRHQLRVHMALMKHAIVGDQTYAPTDSEISRKPKQSQSSTQERVPLTLRMCLHAQQLVVENLLPPEGPTLPSFQTLSVEAPDPFRVVKGAGGELSNIEVSLFRGDSS